MNRYWLVLFFFVSITSVAQFPQGMGGNRGGQGMRQLNAGHFYGKVVDDKTGKPLEFAVVQLLQDRRDSVSGEMKEALVSGELTQSNGDFSLENLPVFGNYKLRISALGYTNYEQQLSFNIRPGQGGMQQALNAIDKDLGNIKLSVNAVSLKEVSIE